MESGFGCTSLAFGPVPDPGGKRGLAVVETDIKSGQAIDRKTDGAVADDCGTLAFHTDQG